MMQGLIVKGSYDRILEILKENYAALDNTASAFCILSSSYDTNGDVQHSFLDVISQALSYGYGYVNTIVYPTAQIRGAAFNDNVRYVVWLCKSKDHLRFDKDSIREKHIWRDVEWGKRAKNYNPKGKDPGNVWIPTDDDGRAHITFHHMLNDEQVVEKLKRMSGNPEKCITVLEDDADICPVERAVSYKMNEISGAEIRGDIYFRSAEKMGGTDDSSVDCIITSPPYWDLKNYFKEGQIGQEPYPKYLERMTAVWRECFRVLNDHGSLWLNINIRTIAGKPILLPADFITICRLIGFHFKGILIWHKSSGIPTSKNNIVDRHEYILLFSKSAGYRVNDDVFSQIADYKNESINGGAFWNINRKAGSVGKKTIHPAIFPNALAERALLSSTVSGAVIMDPFLGSGTTCIAALNHSRSFVGYEYFEGFKELMESRFTAECCCPGLIDFHM